MIPSLAIKPICYLLVALGLVFGLVHLHTVVYQDGYQAATAKLEKAHAAAIAERVAENDAARSQFAAAAKIQQDDYEKELANVRAAGAAAAARRVPIRAGFCQPRPDTGASKTADAGSAAPAAPASQFLPDEFASDLRQAAVKADEVLAAARAMQAAAVQSGCFAEAAP